MVYKLKTDAETRTHVHLLVNFKGMHSLYPIVKAQTITGRVRIDT